MKALGLMTNDKAQDMRSMQTVIVMKETFNLENLMEWVYTLGLPKKHMKANSKMVTDMGKAAGKRATRSI